MLALDMYEHAYHIDFGAKAAAYVDAFMQNIAWDRVGRRYERAVAGAPSPAPTSGPEEISAETLRDALTRGHDIMILDVRKSEDMVNGQDMLPSARHLDAERFEAWAATLPKDRSIVAYCVYGSAGTLWPSCASGVMTRAPSPAALPRGTRSARRRSRRPDGDWS